MILSASNSRNRKYRIVLFVFVAFAAAVSLILIVRFLIKDKNVKSNKNQNNDMNIDKSIRTLPVDFFFWLHDYTCPVPNKPGVVMSIFMKTKSKNGTFLTCLVPKGENDHYKYTLDLWRRPTSKYFDFLKDEFLSKRKSDLLTFRYQPELKDPCEINLTCKNNSKIDIISKEKNLKFHEFLESVKPDIEKHSFLAIFRSFDKIGFLTFDSFNYFFDLQNDGRCLEFAKTRKFEDKIASLLAFFIQENQIDSSKEDLEPALV
ncbi:hypothetical protein M153_2460006729 [Pseudoloma neurophilia]|uniref:Uncharacterized protein n=1 Tax=Pseudoloma neurophilia TaxID=146866 RepID=A0A0R0M4H0_9MICR|nr:hypothetical protein M153_2460006729 [Pseudoloma neurophilia]